MLPQIRLDRSADAPLHQQLTAELRRVILAGELPPGTLLPSSRRAAAELGISRNLVVLAYERLQLEGYLRSAVGVGTWVPGSLAPHLLRPAPAAPADPEVPEAPTPRLSQRGQLLTAHRSPLEGTRRTFPLRPAAVAADLFPVRTWVRIATRSWRRRTTELVHYGDVQGYRPLREALAEHLSRYRAVRVSADQILMTSGSQQSLDIIAQMLLDPGDPAAIEDPGYDGASSCLAAVGARIVPVPVDEEGMDLSAAGPLDGIRLLYTTPSHQYPLGVTLALERRLQLLQWAQRAGSWIVEDDYDSEFRFESRPLPSLQGLDRAGRVLYVGTFSKVLASALRIGFIVLPDALVEPFVRARQVVDHHPPITIQATLAQFIAEGHLERHISRMRNVYRERREALLAALQDAFGEQFPIVPGDGGLHVTMLLGEEIDDTAVSRLAFRRSIDPQPLSVHYRGPRPRNGLVLGYGAVPPEQLASAVAVLRACVDAVGGTDRTAGGGGRSARPGSGGSGGNR